MELVGFALEIKNLSEEGRFTAIASTPVLDRQNDIVEKGSFVWSESGVVPMLFAHKHDQPIGVFRNITNTEEGLVVEGELNLDTVKGRESWSLLKQGALKALSVGFTILEKALKDGIRYIQKAELHEISLVTIPANPEARILALKEHDERIEQLTQEIEELKQHLSIVLEQHFLLQLAHELRKAVA